MILQGGNTNINYSIIILIAGRKTDINWNNMQSVDKCVTKGRLCKILSFYVTNVVQEIQSHSSGVELPTMLRK